MNYLCVYITDLKDILQRNFSILTSLYFSVLLDLQ